MAEKIKGITLEIGGDTTALTKALGGVNKTTKDLQGELKNVERLLKLDPKNTELLAQKQKILTEAVGATKEKLDTLKEAERQAQEQFKKGEISEQQYRALQREVVKTEQDLGKLESQLKETANASRKLGEDLQKAGDKMNDTGKGLTTKVTAPIIAAGAAAVAAFSEVDAGMDIVIKKTGATGETAKDLEKTYKDLASSVPDDLKDVGAAIGELNTRFDFTGDTLKTASEDFLKFAKINETDVNSSIQLVSRAMGDAGIESSEYRDILDKLTVAAQKSGIGMDSLTTNLAKYGAPMRALGIDTNTSIAMFAGWEKAGVNTEIAFAGMKKAISNWGSQGLDSSKEFEKALDAIKKAPDIATATSMAIDIFGQKAGPDLADAIKGGRFEVNDYIKALEEAGGAVENTYAGIVDGKDDAKTAFNQIKVAASEFGDIIITTLAPILKELGEKIRELGEWFAGLSPEMKKTIIIVAGIVAAIGPVLIVLGMMASALGSLIALAPIMVTAGTAIGGAFTIMLGPVGLIIAGIAALIAIGVLLYKNWDVVKERLSNIWDAIKTNVVKVFNGIKDFFVEWGPLILAIITGPIGLLVYAIAKNWDDIKSKTIGIFDGIKGFFAKWGDDVTRIVTKTVNSINQKISDMINIGQDFVKGLWKGIKNMGSWFQNLVTGFVGDKLVGPIKKLLRIQSPSKLMEEIGEFITLGLANGIESGGGVLNEKAEKVVTKATETMMKAVDEYNNQVEKALENMALEEEKLTQEYEGQLDRRASALYGWIGIFDEVPEKMKVTGKELLENLKGQVEYFGQWQNEIAELSKKAVDEGLIDELRQMGPKALPQIEALNSMSGRELEKYVSLWQEKHELAKEEATDELEGLKAETSKKIDELHKKTNEQLELYAIDFVKKMNDMRVKTGDELKAMSVEAQTHGSNMMTNLVNGILDKLPELNNAMARVKAAMDVGDGDIGVSMGFTGIPAMATGTNYVPRNMLAYLHKGEAVVPAKYNQAGTTIGNININITGNNPDEIWSKFERNLHKMGVVF